MRFVISLILVLAASARGEEHNHARDELELGTVMPFSEILEIVEARLGGRVLDVAFRDHGGGHVYRFDIITPDGRMTHVDVDAATGAILDTGDSKIHRREGD